MALVSSWGVAGGIGKYTAGEWLVALVSSWGVAGGIGKYSWGVAGGIGKYSWGVASWGHRVKTACPLHVCIVMTAHVDGCSYSSRRHWDSCRSTHFLLPQSRYQESGNRSLGSFYLHSACTFGVLHNLSFSAYCWDKHRLSKQVSVYKEEANML